ncbi:hypothetical protein ABZ128_34485 [Streptomyces sp. NPDC006326]|uniref:hypothetical protein n=1 Tax=Streptomyces sp. NPDC006326 TaxID=3156752 RepID=UPI0033B5FD08
MKRRPLAIAAGTVGVLATVAFALPNLPPNPVTDSVNDTLFEEKSRHFVTAADAPRQEKRAFALPAWIPADATDIRIRERSSGKARVIRFTLGATPLDGPQCSSGTPKRQTGPKLGATWWPRGTRAEERPECRDFYQYQVTVRGKRVYAWTDGTPSPTAG